MKKEQRDTKLMSLDIFMPIVFDAMSMRDFQAAVLGQLKRNRAGILKRIDTARASDFPLSLILCLENAMMKLDEAIGKIEQPKLLNKKYCAYHHITQQGVWQA